MDKTGLILEVIKMKTNILVQYQGGGYSGCIWEWNYFFIDNQGVFHDINSTGSGAITTIEQARELLESDSTHYVYDVTNDDSIAEFSKECNVVHVAGVLKWFNDYNDPEIEFFAICSECGCKITDYDDLSLEEWRGCGGIASTADSLLCYECVDNGTCDNCSDYAGETNIVALEQIDNNDYSGAVQYFLDENLTHVCTGCLEYKRDELKKEQREDMLHQSLLTGTPDLFSDEMRWFRN